MSHSFDERFVFSPESATGLIYNEHLARYQFATQFAGAKRVLDCASGSGYGSQLLAEAGATSVIGVDVDATALQEARAKFTNPKLEFRQADAERLSSIADGSIDLIVSFETIEHLHNYPAYLASLKRVLAPNGLALISTPNRAVFGQKNPFHVHEFERSEFESELAKHFSQVTILDQYNGLASMIVGQDAQATVTSTGEAQYFIAICGDELPETYQGRSSFNGDALARWQANPGWRMVNGLYSVLVKMGLIRR